MRLDRFDHLVRTVRSIAATRPTSGSADLCVITTRPPAEWTERLLEISTELRRTHFLLSPAPA